MQLLSEQQFPFVQIFPQIICPGKQLIPLELLLDIEPDELDDDTEQISVVKSQDIPLQQIKSLLKQPICPEEHEGVA